MQDQNKTLINQDATKKDSFLGLIVRIIWMGIGFIPFVLFFRLIMKANERVTKWDFFYWGLYILLVVLKYVDYKYLNGETAEGERATIINVRDYAIRVFIFIVVFYIIAKYEALSGKY